MIRHYVNYQRIPDELKAGIQELCDAGRVSKRRSTGAIQVVFLPGHDGVGVEAERSRIVVRYGSVNDAFRGLGLILARDPKERSSLRLHEKRRLERVFVMLDASRNGVLNLNAAKQWIRFMGLAGINGFMLYTEDTYEIPGEPLFGYMRGRYTSAELSELDEYACAFGIEMIPCIQALAHLQRVLQYNAYARVSDTTSVLMAGEKETYRFVEKMIRTASLPYRSRRIHIGMDEAWDLGRGGYLTRNGYVKPFDIMVAHLDQVLKITRRLRLKPMMWSDMFFRTLSPSHGYYDRNMVVTKAIARRIPKDIDLVYWDYGHTEVEDYSFMIDRHNEMGSLPIVANGMHTWNRFWASCERAEKTASSSMKACFQKGIKELIVTIWGDDGTECDYYSALPLLQYISDMNFTGKTTLTATRRNIRGTLDIDYDDWRTGHRLDRGVSNLSKALLWDDPLLGLWQPQTGGRKLNTYYGKLAADLEKLCKRKRNHRLKLPLYLARVLSTKADFPALLLAAYRKNDRRALRKMLSETIPRMAKDIRRLNDYHRDLWLANHKPFGWEVLERRYGGLLGSFRNLERRLSDYLEGNIDCIEELEQKRVAMNPTAKGWNAHTQSAARVQSTGQIFHKLP